MWLVISGTPNDSERPRAKATTVAINVGGKEANISGLEGTLLEGDVGNVISDGGATEERDSDGGGEGDGPRGVATEVRLRQKRDEV